LNDFSPSQQLAYEAANKGKNIFITGSGGNGKSYLTERLITPSTVVCAPTGIAALRVKGITCHRAFALPIGLPQDEDKWKISKEQSEILKRAERVIISEIGMLRIDQMELIDAKMKRARGNKKPFGGLQMIVEGDFFQLEPIVSRDEEFFFYKKYKHPFCFGFNGWNFEAFDLCHPQRNKNKKQYDLLNKIRQGDVESLPELFSEVKKYALSDEGELHLCTRKENAAIINEYYLKGNLNADYTFDADISGDISEKDVIVPAKLILKVGCKVLICANNPDIGYVNGDTGIVISISGSRVFIKLSSGANVEVVPHTWYRYAYAYEGKNLVKKVIGYFKQLPITLGWAISIHKSQGMTLDSAAIHNGNGCFGHGQFYVAVSRVKNLNNLSFVRSKKSKEITGKDLIVKDDVKKFYNKIKYKKRLDNLF